MSQDPAGAPASEVGADEPVAVLVTLGSELAGLFDRLARRYGNVTLVQYRTLALLRAHEPEPLEPWELARGLRTGSAHVTMVLDGLTRLALVERLPHASDRRRRLVRLTPGGRERAERLGGHMGDLERRLLDADLTARERDRLIELAGRLRETIATLSVPEERVRPGP